MRFGYWLTTHTLICGPCVLLATMSVACSSDSTEQKQELPKAGSGGQGSAGREGTSSGGTGPSGQGGSTTNTTATKECQDYCACFAEFCSEIQTIPGGVPCLDFCATFTPKIWDCRISHCRLVVPENNPHHCEHAVGIDQCK